MFKLSKICSSLIKHRFCLTSPLVSLNESLSFSFGKWSKPPKKIMPKERKAGVAISDEKGAKLAKEEEAEEKKKKIEAEKKKIERSKIKKIPIKSFDQKFDIDVSKTELSRLSLEQVKLVQGIKAANKMIDTMIKMKNEKPNIPAFLKPLQSKLEQRAKSNKPIPLKELFKTPNQVNAVTPHRLKHKTKKVFFNTEPFVNQQFKVKPIETVPDDTIRTGLLARKVGMIGLWDKWGTRHSLTVLQVDRCQVIQVKTKEKDGYYALQIGAGQKSLKYLKKPEIGHFLKHEIPPKEKLSEFKITKENILPPGFQLGARHFVPGQYVDISGVTNGKGFQGTVKRWHFKMQPATHGCSVSHRVMGSTGNRTDPGRVFKGKKMPGRMGNQIRMTYNLKIYKVDADKCLIYVKGSVPGRAGNFVKIRDAWKKGDINEEFLNFPTFIPDPKQVYASEVIMEPPEEDPEEIYEHDNVHVKDDDKVDTSATPTTGPPM